jgi:hypothetical protein
MTTPLSNDSNCCMPIGRQLVVIALHLLHVLSTSAPFRLGETLRNKAVGGRSSFISLASLRQHGHFGALRVLDVL